MEKALIVCDAPKGLEYYESFLRQNGFDYIRTVKDSDSGRRAFIDDEYDICIVNAPMKNGNAISLAIDIASKNLCQVILFVKEEIFEATLEAVEKYGILTIAKPVNRQMFWAAIKMSKALTVRMSIANDKIRRLQIKLDETKLVSQAKCLLIANKGLSEEEAHRYIEKQAMDQRTSRVAIADSIVDFYKED